MGIEFSMLNKLSQFESQRHSVKLSSLSGEFTRLYCGIIYHETRGFHIRDHVQFP